MGEGPSAKKIFFKDMEKSMNIKKTQYLSLRILKFKEIQTFILFSLTLYM